MYASAHASEKASGHGICASIYACICACTWACICACISVCIRHLGMRLCRHLGRHLRMHRCVHTYVHLNMYLGPCVHLRMCERLPCLTASWCQRDGWGLGAHTFVSHSTFSALSCRVTVWCHSHFSSPRHFHRWWWWPPTLHPEVEFSWLLPAPSPLLSRFLPLQLFL